MARSKHLLDQGNPRPSAEQLGGDWNCLDTLSGCLESSKTMVDQFMFKIRSDEVASASRHPWQYVHNLHARTTARR